MEDGKKSLAVFSKWTPDPSSNFREFVARADGTGGYAVVETDNVKAIARDAALFATWFEFSVTPVLDMLDGVAANQEALAIYDSAQ
jgi:hypothetical protein